MIKYKVEENNAVLDIKAVKDETTTIHLPAQIDGKTIVSANYTAYRGRITHDGEHNYNADKICQICGEEDPGLAINETNFPDEKFREYVKEKFDKDSNNYLSDEEIGKITGIFVAGKGITTLKGIEHFNRVTYIDAKNNNITDELDLSGCPILATLYVDNSSKLTSIKFGDVSKLGDLTCKNTGITELDLSGASNLSWLDCRNDDYKGVLESLNLSGAVKLRQLYCLGNKLTKLDLSNCPNLKKLHCEGNRLTSLALPAKAENLEDLNCSENRQLTSLVLGKYDSLKTLHCGTTGISSLDLTNVPNLETLYCFSSKLTSLDASPCKNLTFLSCSVNFPMTELNVSQNTQLKTLQCGNTALTSLDLSNNTVLEQLDCKYCHLTYLDVSKNTALKGLNCSNNQLAFLDLTKNTALETVEADNNISAVDGCKWDLFHQLVNSGFHPSYMSNLQNIGFDDKGEYIYIFENGLSGIAGANAKYTYKMAEGKTQDFYLNFSEHNLEKTDYKAPTCTEDGNNAYWVCNTCGKMFKATNCHKENVITEIPVIEKRGHTLTHIEEKPVGCTHNGQEEYWYCTTCLKYFSDESCENEIEKPVVIEAEGHKLTKTAEKPATCTENGHKEYWTCSVCHKLFSDENGENEIDKPVVIQAKGHTVVTDPAVEPTCHSTGLTAGSHCSVCGTIIAQQKSVPMTAHTYGKWTITKEPTLTETGFATHKCENCVHTEEKNIEKLTDETVWTKDPDRHKDPTEDEPGQDVYESEYGEVIVVLPKIPVVTTSSAATQPTPETSTSADTNY